MPTLIYNVIDFDRPTLSPPTLFEYFCFEPFVKYVVNM